MSNVETNLKVVVTGGGGFLGWHTRIALKELGSEVSMLRVGNNFSEAAAVSALEGSNKLIHLAGVNRASDEEILNGNILFATQMAQALAKLSSPPQMVVFANSTQANSGTLYGEAKKRSSEILEQAAASIGASFVSIELPNLFGEHGRPFYNAVTSTFCKILVDGGEPEVESDKTLTLMHAQDAADLLVGNLGIEFQESVEQHESVSGLLGRIRSMHQTYAVGQIPNISTKFDRDLFNTYRSYVADKSIGFDLIKHSDPRGSFTELIRVHGGSGQSSFSTTEPGILRGGHFHRRKVERFVVLSGKARISVRRVFTDQVIHFDVDGDSPLAIDMPTMWAHSIKNTGDELLLTHFWTDDLFDPANPDTIVEEV